MSFGDLESGGGHAALKARQWSSHSNGSSYSEDSSFEQQIRANIQEMQESVRLVKEQLDRSRNSYVSKRMGDSFNESLDRGRELAQETEQLFRDWTVHLAGEPTARHKKKFSYEKLQKAFREEVQRLKDAGRRAIAVRQEALSAEGRYSGDISVECHGMCEDQGSSVSDEEHALLASSDISEVATVGEDVAIQNRIATERAEGIRRVQSQVADVNQMFRDLASIVNEQGQQFVTIETQAEVSSTNTKLATKELKKTADRQRSQYERLCCMLVSAMLVLCFVVVSHMPQHLQHLPSSHPGALPNAAPAASALLSQAWHVASPQHSGI